MILIIQKITLEKFKKTNINYKINSNNFLKSN